MDLFLKGCTRQYLSTGHITTISIIVLKGGKKKMKAQKVTHILFTLMMILMISSIAPSALADNTTSDSSSSGGSGGGTPVYSCSDTDGGANSLIQGSTTGTVGTSVSMEQDYCSSNTLYEFYCYNDKKYATTVDCAKGCVEGSCVIEDSTIGAESIYLYVGGSKTYEGKTIKLQEVGPNYAQIYVDNKYFNLYQHGKFVDVYGLKIALFAVHDTTSQRGATIYVRPLADPGQDVVLRIGGWSIQPRNNNLEIGEKVTVKPFITNYGQDDADNVEVTVSLFRDSNYQNRVYLTTQNIIGGVPAGENVETSFVIQNTYNNQPVLDKKGTFYGRIEAVWMDNAGKSTAATGQSGNFYYFTLTVTEEVEEPEPSCTETDNGMDFFNKGTTAGVLNAGNDLFYNGNRYIAGQYTRFADVCDTTYSDNLHEAYCSSGKLKITTTRCNYGCSNGACLDEDVPPQTVYVNVGDTFKLSEEDTAKFVGQDKSLVLKSINSYSGQASLTYTSGTNTPSKTILHRDHKYCEDDSYVTSAPNGGKNQVFEVGGTTGYTNYKCQNRKTEQCEILSYTDSDEELVLYLPFDEGAGNTANDQSGNGHSGTIVQPKWVDGKEGAALDFRRQGSYVRVPNHEDLQLDQFRIEAWIKPTGNVNTWAGSYQTILAKEHEYILRFANGHDEKGSGRIFSSVIFGTSGQEHANSYLESVRSATLELGKIVQTDDGSVVVPEKTVYLEMGDSTVVDGKTVTLERVNNAAVVVSVDGTSKTLYKGETDNFNGLLHVRLPETGLFYNPGFTFNENQYAYPQYIWQEFTMNSNEWHKVEWSYDGQYITLTLDGQNIAVTKYKSTSTTSAYDLIIGNHINAFSRDEFMGAIDEVKIYKIGGVKKPVYAEGDSYYNEWCDYQAGGGSGYGTHFFMNPGETKQLDTGIVLNYLSRNGGVATFKTTENVVIIDPDDTDMDSSEIVSTDYILGNRKAPVTIIAYGDYECPFCKRFVDETFDQIKINYIDTNKVKYVFREFPLSFHPNAKEAAQAAECAGKQGKYWEMHDELYANGNVLSKPLYAKLAQRIGLNEKTFVACMDDKTVTALVEKEMKWGNALGVRGTPAFFINGEKLVGAQPYNVFEQMIEKHLYDDDVVIIDDPVIIDYPPVIEEPPEFPGEEGDEVTLTLNRGWNLVSLSGYMLQAFTDSTCDESRLFGFIYLEDEGRYVSLENAYKYIDDLEEYVSKHAFWVYSYNTCTLSADVESDTMLYRLHLTSGWNVVPVLKSFVGNTVQEVAGNCNIQSVYAWESKHQEWDKGSVNGDLPEEGLFQGLLIKVARACTMEPVAVATEEVIA